MRTISRSVQRILFVLCSVFAVGAIVPHALAAAPELAGTPLAASTGERILSFAQLGESAGLRLRGADASGVVNFGVRLDRAVTAAKLRLRYTYSPALLPQLSQLKVYLNEEPVATLPYDKEGAGKVITREIALDPRLLSGFNRIRLQMIGHYTTECEDPMHSSMWTDISAASDIVLSTQPLILRDDLAMLPAPFFDRRDNRRVEIPFVFAQTPSLPVAHAAGVIASWFGALADYRDARFPVLLNQLPARHAVVFATNDARPAGLSLPAVQGPTITMMSRPRDPAVKLLVLQGRDAKDLEAAALALASGSAALSGALARIQTSEPAPRRKPYDAPRWIRTDRPVRLGELVNDPTALQVQGYQPGAIRVDLRVPADLLTWQNRGIPLDLKYRYTPPLKQDDSSLSVSINGRFVRAYRLRPSGLGGDKSRMILTLLSDGSAAQQESLLIPAFQVGSNNRLSFQFELQPQKGDACALPDNAGAHAAIDADSTIDFSGMQHYTQMPNLGYFANSGFPFTKYADLSQTAVVMPSSPDPAELETLFTLLGQLSKWTGIYAERFQLVDTAHVDQVRDRDLLVIGSGDVGALLARWGKDLPLLIEQGQRIMASHRGENQRDSLWRTAAAADSNGPGRLVAHADGPLAAVVGFESPYGHARSVVAVSATRPDDLHNVLDALEDNGQRLDVHGDLAVMTPGKTESFRLGGTYDVGNVPFWTRIWFHLSNYPILLALAGMLAAIALAAKCYGWLQQRAARRLGK